jgi:hypothetical protein
MSLRIAVDLDGTLADMDAALQLEAERLFGPGVDLRGSLRGRPESVESETPDTAAATPGDRPQTSPPASRRLTDRQQRQLWLCVQKTPNFWADLKEIEPGAVAKLAAMTAAHRWEVIFLTQRPPCAGDTAQIQTQRWLQAHGFELPSVFVVSGSRGRIATALTLDAVVDDRPDNCLDVATDSKALPLLVWRDTPETVPPGAARLGITVVFSMAEALDKLDALQRPPSPPPATGVMGRIRQTLGI